MGISHNLNQVDSYICILYSISQKYILGKNGQYFPKLFLNSIIICISTSLKSHVTKKLQARQYLQNCLLLKLLKHCSNKNIKKKKKYEPGAFSDKHFVKIDKELNANYLLKLPGYTTYFRIQNSFRKFHPV